MGNFDFFLQAIDLYNEAGLRTQNTEQRNALALLLDSDC